MKFVEVILLQSILFCFAVQLSSASPLFRVETGYSDCPCTHPLDCATLPAYGENPLDILLFGTHQPCPRWGEIRCCPRRNSPAFDPWSQAPEEKLIKTRGKHRLGEPVVLPVSCVLPLLCLSAVTLISVTKWMLRAEHNFKLLLRSI